MIASPARIEPWQRHTKKTQDCPICGGNADDRRGRGERCWGYISQDERYAYCTQIAGGTLQQRSDGTYKHRIDGGACWCGDAHGAGAGETTRRHMPAPARETTPAKVYAAIPDWLPGADGYRRATTYDYHDAGGALVYTVARYERDGQPKQIRPFCPVPDGWEMRKADSVVLYRLPDLHAADPWAPVYICEGEKDADRLASGGLVATTNAFGAGSWHTVADAARARLAGRAVVILEDNDDAGRARTAAILASLEGAAASIRMMRFTDLPEHGDVSDWLDAGHTAGELHRICATLPVWMPSAQYSSPATQDASLGNENAPACLSCARLKEQLRIAETSLANLRRERAVENHFLAIPNEKMSAPTKLAALAVRRELSEGSHQHNGKGHANIPRAFIARRMGVKAQAAGAHLIKLEKQRIIERDEKKAFDETTIFIGRGAHFDTPEAVEAPARANTWGGVRKPRCAACNSEHLKPHTYVCEECGTISSAADALAAAVNYDLKHAAEAAGSGDSASPAQDPSPAMQDASTMPEAGTGDTNAATQDHSPPPDMRVNDLVSLGEMSTASQHSAGPCLQCGGQDTYWSPVGLLVCRKCVAVVGRRGDELTLAATG